MSGNITTPVPHRVIRSVCLAGAIMAPLLAGSACRSISRLAVEHVLPHSDREHFPTLTQGWIVGVANGGMPLLLIAFSLSALVAASGFYSLFSKRLSTDASASALPVICCVAYTTALLFAAVTLMALVLPFLPMATE